jgi:hypothetical protein
MPTPTYTLIASSTVGSGGAADITFSSISSSYTDLCLKISMRTNRASTIDPVQIQFNGDTGSNYSYRSLWSESDGSVNSFSSGSPDRIDAQYAAANDTTANTFTNFEIYIPNYTSSNQKSTSYDSAHENNATTAYLVMMANRWTGTAAINSIKIDPLNGNFVQYTTAYLYGIVKS